MCLFLVGSLSNAEARRFAEGPDSLAEATALRISGRFEAAATLLERYLEHHPGSPRATLLLAQTYYWMNNFESARRLFREGVRRHPDYDSLKLEYARMLVEMNQGDEARPLLRQLLENETAAPEAMYLLGTLSYWSGDLPGARYYYLSALRLNPRHFYARRMLKEIRRLSAPWIRLSSVYQHDSQPLKQLNSYVEGGWFLAPLLPVTIAARSQNFSVGDRTPSSSSLEVAVRNTWPASGLRMEVAAGLLKQSFADKVDWTGRARASIELSKQFALSVGAERVPYLFTTSSLEEAVMVQSVGGSLEMTNAHGWYGKAGYRRQYFPDANAAGSAYSWLLAPLHRSLSLELHVGYGFNYQNARENRFRPAEGSPKRSRDDDDEPIPGVYVPYYTPQNQKRHDVVGSMIVKFQNRVSLSVNLSYGVYATEDAPYFYSDDDDDEREKELPGTGLYVRRFYPWTIGGKLNVDLSSGITLVLQGEHQRTAFYETTYIGGNLLFRMLSR